MDILFNRNFKRQYKKLRIIEREKTQQRLRLFMQDQNNPILNNHALKGEYCGFYSINIAGDLRALYRLVKKDVALFIIIDTHSNLYD